MIKKLLIPVVVISMLKSLTACPESNESKDSTTTISQSEVTTTQTETELATTTEVITQTATATPRPPETTLEPPPENEPEYDYASEIAQAAQIMRDRGFEDEFLDPGYYFSNPNIASVPSIGRVMANM